MILMDHENGHLRQALYARRKKRNTPGGTDARHTTAKEAIDGLARADWDKNMKDAFKQMAPRLRDIRATLKEQEEALRKKMLAQEHAKKAAEREAKKAAEKESGTPQVEARPPPKPSLKGKEREVVPPPSTSAAAVPAAVRSAVLFPGLSISHIFTYALPKLSLL